MRRTVQLFATLLAIPLAGLGLGCSTTTVDVTFDESEDFSRYQTWNWLPRVPHRVDAPFGNEAALDSRLARVITRTLTDQGLERADSPDFFVTYHLALQRRAELLTVPEAPYQLSSHHSSPSYYVESSHQEWRVYEVFKLAVGFTLPDGRMPWRAVMVRRVEDGASLPLDDAVDDLLGRFRPRSPARSDDEPH